MQPPATDITESFFKLYEHSIRSNDPDLLRSVYHGSFLFGGPAGSQTVKLEDFLRAVPKLSAYMRSLGLSGTRLVSTDTLPMDDVYCMVKVVWEMTVERPGLPEGLLESKASYILQRYQDSFRIVAQIDHQDLLEKLKGL